VQVAAMAPCYCESLQTQQHASQLHRLLSWLQTCSRSACCLPSACLLPMVHPTGEPNIYLILGLFFHHCHTAYFFPFFCPLLFAANEYIQHVPTLTYLMQAVERFGLSPTAAAAHIAALAQLTASRGEAKVSDSAAASQKPPHTTAWGSIVLQGAEEELGRFVEQVPVLSSVVS